VEPPSGDGVPRQTWRLSTDIDALDRHAHAFVAWMEIAPDHRLPQAQAAVVSHFPKSPLAFGGFSTHVKGPHAIHPNGTAVDRRAIRLRVPLHVLTITAMT
jgi:hypothetical protein